MSSIMAKKHTGLSNRSYIAGFFLVLVVLSLHVARAGKSHRPPFQPTANSFSTSILTRGNQKISLHCRPFLSTYRPKTDQGFRRAVWKYGANGKTSW